MCLISPNLYVQNHANLRKMADTAFDWASRHSLVRTSEIHGEQEAKLVLEESFHHEQLGGEQSESKTTVLAEETR